MPRRVAWSWDVLSGAVVLGCRPSGPPELITACAAERRAARRRFGCDPPKGRKTRMRLRRTGVGVGIAIAAVGGMSVPAHADWKAWDRFTTKSKCIDAGQQYVREGFN